MALIPDLAEGVILLDHQNMPRANLRAFGGAMESQYRGNGCRAADALWGKSFVTCE